MADALNETPSEIPKSHTPLITLRNIHKSFGSLEVLGGIDLHVGREEIVSIVGPSGAGKTTLLQIMGTLYRPDCGSVEIAGTDVLRLRPNALSQFRCEHLGFIFQFHQLLPEFTLVENVAMPALIGGTRRKEAFERAAVLLRRLGLDNRANHKPAELSGGECQRAAVARALVNNPAVVLADEPSGSLDLANRAKLHELFFELRDEMKATFVIVTHDENLAADSDIIVRMADGRISNITHNKLK